MLCAVKTTCALPVGRNALERDGEASGERPDVARVVVVLAELVDRRARPDQRLRARRLDVLEVLATRRVRAESGRDERERSLDPVVSHLAHDVGQVRVPVAIAPVDGQRVAGPRELGVEGRDQRSVLPVDRAHAPEPLVLLGDEPADARAARLRPRVTFSRNGRTSSGPSGPPNDTTITASYDSVTALSVAEPGSHVMPGDADGNGHGSYASRRPKDPGAHHLRSPPAEPACRIASQPAARGNDHRRHGPRHRRHRVVPLPRHLRPRPRSGCVRPVVGHVGHHVPRRAWLLPPRRARGDPCARPPPGDRQRRGPCHRPSGTARRHPRSDPRRHHTDRQPVDGRAPLRRLLAAARRVPPRPRRVLRRAPRARHVLGHGPLRRLRPLHGRRGRHPHGVVRRARRGRSARPSGSTASRSASRP